MNPPSDPMHLLIIGCGDIGARLAERMLNQDWQVSAVRRNPALLPAGVQGFAGDYTEPGGLASIANIRADVCLFTPLPVARDAAGYQQGFCDSVDVIQETGVLDHCRRLLYVSSTRVYAEQSGGLVDETAPTTSTDSMGMAIVSGEARARDAAPTTVVRPAGVYGAMPAMLIERVARGDGAADPDRISNRIHRDDLAGLLALLAERAIGQQPLPDIVNAADDEPAPIGVVEAWLAARLGVDARPSTEGKSVRGNRRVSNTLLHELGYVLRYPSWREGYTAMLADRSPQSG